MATTGISALGNDQIIAIAALSSKNAATAEYTTGGDGLQGLYDTVHDNSASWTGGGGGADYTAGAGIDITNDVISVTGKENTITYGYSGDAISSLNGHAIISDSIPYEVYGISASANISAYESDSALWISGRDWTPELNNKLDTTAFSTVSGNFLTAHQSLPQSANWNSTYNTVHDNSASWTGGGGGGVEYSGITPIVVNNTSHEISADTWGLAIGNGLSAVEDAVNKQTIISVTSQAGITDIVSATALPATPVSTVLYLITEA